jgi:two-component system cell cycle sensor histidine kinase/response regulator CckA
MTVLGERTEPIMKDSTTDSRALAPAEQAQLGKPPTLADNGTQTIDINTLVCERLTASGSFDLRQERVDAFGKLLQALSIPTVLIAHPHKVEFANEAFSTMFRGAQPTRDANFLSLFSDPSNRGRLDSLLKDVFTRRQPAVAEAKLRIHESGVWVRIHLRTMRVAEDRIVLAQIENLSAQKELQAVQKYKSLVSIVPFGVAEFRMRWGVDCSLPCEQLLDNVIHARLVDGNDEFARSYKFESIRDLAGMTLGRLFPVQSKRKAFCERWIQEGFPTRSFEAMESQLGGYTKIFEFTFIVSVKGKELVGFWLLKKDISEKRRTEQELRKAQKLESLGLLAGGLAHDFNNLLTAIVGNIELGKQYSDHSQKSLEKFEAATKAVWRAQDLTRQLLTFSKGGDPVKATASIKDLLNECAAFALRGSNVRCELLLREEVWPVEVDQGQISQVAHNLFINAIQAMPQGGVILVRAKNLDIREERWPPLRAGKYVKVTIADQGVGIAKEHLQRVFDPYFTTKDQGSGLGLATCYSIITKHGGFITLKSKPGVGTAVHFYLPAGQSAIVAAEVRTSGRANIGKRILVMDDDKVIRNLAAEFLTLGGCEVTVAKDGREATMLYEQAMQQGSKFDLVILDLTIPGGMGGKETLVRMLTLDPKVRAIASSGYSHDPIMSDFRSHGFVAVLPKPYDGNQIQQVVDQTVVTSRETE